MILIVFLAFCELLVCTNNLGNYFTKHGGAVFGFKVVVLPELCTFHWYITFFGIYCGWTTLAVIALVRCLAVVSKAFQKIFANKRIFCIIIPTIILFSFLAAIPFFFEVLIYFCYFFMLYLFKAYADGSSIKVSRSIFKRVYTLY